MKRCPYCGEEIQDSATKCRFCGEWLEKQPAKEVKGLTCTGCGTVIQDGAYVNGHAFCVNCIAGKTETTEVHWKRRSRPGVSVAVVGVSLVLLIIFAGYSRIYYGGGIKTRIIPKHSFSFKDTIVNLDNILGKPRIVVAAQHPAIKRQLEEMGIIETDEQIQERVQKEIEEKTEKAMKQAEEQAKKVMKEYENMYKDLLGN